MQAVEAVGANLPDPQASQKVASKVEDRPALHAVQFALDGTENLPALQLEAIEPVDANLPPPQV